MDDMDSGSEVEFNSTPTSERGKSQRSAAKKVMYDLDSDESSNEELELHENEAVKENNAPAYTNVLSSDSESDLPPRRNETSEDMFDSLIGKKPGNQNSAAVNGEDKTTSKRKSLSGSESEPESKSKKKKVETAQKKVIAKKTKPLDSDSDMSFDDDPKPTKSGNYDSDSNFDDKPKKTKSKKKKTGSDSDGDFGEKLSKSKPQKKKTTKKIAKGSDSEDEPLGIKKSKKAPAKSVKGKAKTTKKTSDSEDDVGSKKTKRKNVVDIEDSDSEEYQPPAESTSRTARAAAPKKYVFSDDDD